MASKQIHDYTAANSIDASADYLLIDPASTGIYKKISRNVLLALNSAPLGTTDSQSPQNKTLDNTNSITVKDGSLTIQNSAATTKQAVFSAASITAGQTRTFTLPDASGTLVTTAGTQTLTNKTFTSPTITGGTIDNSTVTVDSISGHSVATTVTVANLQIANGVLNTANSVTATSIAVGAIQPQALVTGTGSGWAFQSWTPTWTNLTVGSSTVTAKYIQIGKTVFVRLMIALGAGSAISGQPQFTLPVTSISYPSAGTAFNVLGLAWFEHTGVTNSQGYTTWVDTTHVTFGVANAAGTYLSQSAVSSSVPFVFATGDSLNTSFFYEAA